MKTSITTIAKIAGGLTLMAASSVAMASVINTKHNLGAGGTNNHTNGTTEICVFCHTPHGGNQSVDAPIWNRKVSSSGVYTRFSSLGRITFDAREAPIGSVSIACLSCHDGTQAMNAVINSPGSDSSYTVGTGTLGGGVGGWSQTNMMSTLTPSDNGSTTGDIIYLGTDLRNDHPISMQYGGGGINQANPTGGTGGTTNDKDFAKAAATGTGSYGLTAASNGQPGNTSGTTTGSGTGLIRSLTPVNGGAIRWYVDTGVAGYQGTDFPLYTRTDATGDSAPQPFVECGTCHDPHSSNSTFLRLPGGNTSSQVCLTCHAK